MPIAGETFFSAPAASLIPAHVIWSVVVGANISAAPACHEQASPPAPASSACSTAWEGCTASTSSGGTPSVPVSAATAASADTRSLHVRGAVSAGSAVVACSEGMLGDGAGGAQEVSEAVSIIGRTAEPPKRRVRIPRPSRRTGATPSRRAGSASQQDAGQP